MKKYKNIKIDEKHIYDISTGVRGIYTFIYDDGNLYFKKKYEGYTKKEAREKFEDDLIDEGKV